MNDITAILNDGYRRLTASGHVKAADEITRLRADLTRQIDINTSLASECDRLREANKELVKALQAIDGEHGHFMGQVATMLGGISDAYKINDHVKLVVEEMYKELHRLDDDLDALLSKHKGEQK